MTQRFLRRIAIVDLEQMRVVAQHPGRQVAARRHHAQVRRVAAGDRDRLRAASTSAATRSSRARRCATSSTLGGRPDLDLRDLRQPGAVPARPDGMVRAGLQCRRDRHAGRRPDPGDRSRHALLRATLAAREGRRRRSGRRRPRLHGAEQARHRPARRLHGRPIRSPTRSSTWCACWGFAPPRLERLVPWLHDNALASFLVYFVALRLRRLLAAPRPAHILLVVGAAQPASQPAPA